jgi:hypothetical protein
VCAKGYHGGRPYYGQCVECQRSGVDNKIGAGDLVAMVAQPVARTIDRVLGTKVASCASCKARREALNRAVRF